MAAANKTAFRSVLRYGRKQALSVQRVAIATAILGVVPD